MSGTSLDGLDMAFCRFQLFQNQWAFEILQAETVSYSTQLTEQLKKAHTFSAMELMRLDADLAHLYAGWILDFTNSYKIKPDFISSHGHTIFHQPVINGISKKGNPFTTQIASGAIIAALTGYDVISDFRSTDVALGGQGAPLVPIGDKKLFHQYDYCLNLGGIANISYEMKPHSKLQPNEASKRVASDICFVNMALNYLVNSKGIPFDDGGEIARNGLVDKVLLDKLNQLEFIKRPFPKSIGKEYFESQVATLLDHSKLSLENKLRTFCEHVAFQVKKSIKSELRETENKMKDKQKIFITGGGAFNSFLIELFKNIINAEIIIPETVIIEFKEALIFAFLGVLRLRNEENVLNSVTGAKYNSCSGAIYKGTMQCD